MRCLLFLILLVTALSSFARAQDAEFRTSYTGAIFVNPINVHALILPSQDFQPVISASVEWSFVRSEHMGYEVSGGLYPYINRSEVVGRFGIRRFFGSAQAPIGGFWEMTAIGGATQERVTGAVPEPLFGLGLRLGSIRAIKSGSFGFEYGGGPSVILTGGQTQLRLEFYFGVGYLLGREVVIER